MVEESSCSDSSEAVSRSPFDPRLRAGVPEHKEGPRRVPEPKEGPRRIPEPAEEPPRQPERRGRRQLEGNNLRCEICWTIVRAAGMESHQQNSEVCRQWREFNMQLSGKPTFDEAKYAARAAADKQFEAQKNFHCKYCHRSFGKQWDLWQHCSFKHVDSYEAKQHFKSTKGASALPSRAAAAVVLTAGPGSGSGSGGRYRERETREDPPKRNKEKKEKKEKKKGKKEKPEPLLQPEPGKSPTSPHPLASPQPPQPQEPQQPQKEGQLGWLEEEVSQGGRGAQIQGSGADRAILRLRCPAPGRGQRKNSGGALRKVPRHDKQDPEKVILWRDPRQVETLQILARFCEPGLKGKAARLPRPKANRSKSCPAAEGQG